MVESVDNRNERESTMKLIVQRVSEASVTVAAACAGAIRDGFLVLVGCRFDDAPRDAEYLAAKLAALRVFEDEAGKMNRALLQTGGSALLVSQFTLYADTRKGNRPGFELAGDPVKAKTMFDAFVEAVRGALGPDKVATGVFGAEMRVALVNEGPVTLELCSDNQPWHGRP